jgi:hypothetical protein
MLPSKGQQSAHFVLFGVKWVMLNSEDGICSTTMLAKEAQMVQGIEFN